MKEALKLGVILGAANAVLTIMVHLVNKELFFQPKFSLIILAINIGLLVFLGRKILRNPDDILSYGSAVKYLFVGVLVSSVITTVLSTILYSNNESMIEAFEDYTRSSGEWGVKLANDMSGGSEADLQIAIEEFNKKYDAGEVPVGNYPFGFAQLPLTFLLSAVFGLFYALLAGIFVKEKMADPSA